MPIASQDSHGRGNFQASLSARRLSSQPLNQHGRPTPIFDAVGDIQSNRVAVNAQPYVRDSYRKADARPR